MQFYCSLFQSIGKTCFSILFFSVLLCLCARSYVRIRVGHISWRMRNLHGLQPVCNGKLRASGAFIRSNRANTHRAAVLAGLHGL